VLRGDVRRDLYSRSNLQRNGRVPGRVYLRPPTDEPGLGCDKFRQLVLFVSNGFPSDHYGRLDHCNGNGPKGIFECGNSLFHPVGVCWQFLLA
jgi:hypothetical protein